MLYCQCPSPNRKGQENPPALLDGASRIPAQVTAGETLGLPEICQETLPSHALSLPQQALQSVRAFPGPVQGPIAMTYQAPLQWYARPHLQ